MLNILNTKFIIIIYTIKEIKNNIGLGCKQKNVVPVLFFIGTEGTIQCNSEFTMFSLLGISIGLLSLVARTVWSQTLELQEVAANLPVNGTDTGDSVTPANLPANVTDTGASVTPANLLANVTDTGDSVTPANLLANVTDTVASVTPANLPANVIDTGASVVPT